MALQTRKIAVDTNALLSAAAFKVDPIAELQARFGKKARIVVPEQVLAEIEKIGKKGGALKKKAFVARFLIESHGLEAVHCNAAGADAALLSLAKKGFVVATSDKRLGKKILSAGGRIVGFSRGRLCKN
jgi:rRNA-processing protein FCF1